MERNQLSSILKSKLDATAGVADRLCYSISKTIGLGLSPLSLDKLKSISDDEMEIIDALLFRYGSLVSNIQDSIFKSIGEIEEESVSTMSNRDKTNLMERIGALPSAERFSNLAIVRNKLMHDYPEEASKHLDRINFISRESQNLVMIFIGIVDYSKKFGIEQSMHYYPHLAYFYASEKGVCGDCLSDPCRCGKSSINIIEK